MLKPAIIFHALLTVVLLSLSAPTSPMALPGAESNKSFPLLNLTVTDVESILPDLAQKRVIYIGETHDRYEHHLNQLALIKGIHQRKPELAIGMELFQWPFQKVLDRFVAGEIDEAQMLRETEYFSRWRFDYLLYKPILDYARANGIPLLALNVPKELTDKVAARGLGALSEEERSNLPDDFDFDDARYRERIEAVYRKHPQRPGSRFDYFFEVQLCWDEGMAERAAQFLRSHPGHTLVVLAGTGHITEGTGIPNRVARRLPVSSSIVINSGESANGPAMGDYLLRSEPQPLPPRGRLGIYLDIRKDGLYVDHLDKDGAAAKAGIKPKDKLLRVNDMRLLSYADLRIAMLSLVAGDKVNILVRRSHLLRGSEEIVVETTLQ